MFASIVTGILATGKAQMMSDEGVHEHDVDMLSTFGIDSPNRYIHSFLTEPAALALTTVHLTTLNFVYLLVGLLPSREIPPWLSGWSMT